VDARPHSAFRILDWRVSPTEGLLVRGTEVVHLEPKTMEVLVYLASRAGQVVTRDELESDVWRGAVIGYDAITGSIIKLRKALQDDARNPRFIATIPKRGYQLIAPVDPEPGDAPAGLDANPQGVDAPRQPHAVLRMWGLALAGLVVIVLALRWESSVAPPEPDSAGDPPAATLSIAVLPFESLNDDPQQAYLADGITEDLITDLSRLSGLLVIAANASRVYKDDQTRLQAIGSELNADYLLKGSIRRIGDHIRVNAQLVDTKTGFNRWADRYDGDVAQIFSVQSRMTRSIVAAFGLRITDEESQRLSQASTANLKAYDLFQEGQRHTKTQTRESNAMALAAYRKAIEADPDYGRAYGALAVSLAVAFRRGWTDAPLESLDHALTLARRGVALNGAVPQTHWALGFVHFMRQEFDLAGEAVAQAIAVAPSYADAYGLLALISNYAGQPEKAIEYVTKGMRLNPYYTWDYLYNLGHAYYFLGRYDEAIEALTRAQERNENAMPVRLFLAASYVRAGRQDDAEWEVEQIRVANPDETLSYIAKSIPIGPDQMKKHFLDDLRSAGLKD
jgi:TolB-like protein/DNA-binding winged helix-turn-helix (wHTH) protein/tetratricopeptide (TPR) repeat protein